MNLDEISDVIQLIQKWTMQFLLANNLNDGIYIHVKHLCMHAELLDCRLRKPTPINFDFGLAIILLHKF